MYLIVIINSIVCVLGTFVGVLFAGASIISIANMTVAWRGWLVLAALLVPVTFLVSGIGVWQADAWGAAQLVMGLVALPWLYTMVFVIAMIVSFEG